MDIEFKRRDHNGVIWKHTISGVHSWKDETSPHDPYTLRIMRDKNGRSMGGPIVSEIFDWREIHDTVKGD